ncbi:MAG: HDIG domain-containing metalloprotein [Bacteroidota bacterium]
MAKQGKGTLRRWLNVFYHRRLKRRKYLERVGLITSFVVLMALMLTQTYRPLFQYVSGETWQEPDLTAPFDFSVLKHPDTLGAEIEKVLAQVIPVFVKDSSEALLLRQSLIRESNIFFENKRRYQQALQGIDTAKLSALDAGYFIPNFDKNGGEVGSFTRLRDGSELSALFHELVDSVHLKGYIDAYWQDSLGYIALRTGPIAEKLVSVYSFLNDKTLSEWLATRIADFSSEEKYIIEKLLFKELSPNILFSERLTEDEKLRVSSLVVTTRGKISKGDIIIRKGEYVDEETDQILQSLQREQRKRMGNQNIWALFFGEALVILLITGVLLAYLYMHRPHIYKDNRRLSLIFTLFLLTVGSLVLASKIGAFALRVSDTFGSDLNLSYLYLAPVSILAIFISNFFDHRTGFLCNILLALFGATLVQRALEYAFVQIIAGTVAVYSLRQIRQRKTIFYSLGYILAAYLIAYLAFSFFSKSDWHSINYSNLILLCINVALTLLSFNFIYLFERVFKLTSDLTYLELLDTNHPLLQKMAGKAPGTFQHCLQVANLAEASVNAIKGNALLVHVGALFHDIGKIKHPSYFIENASSDRPNPHDEISFKESAEMIIDHVSLGVELAAKYNLPPEIVRFIQTHHGTTRVEYFFRKFVETQDCDDGVEENCFRYKGPLPESKETAVLMIVDSVEAASRVLSHPSPKSLRELINGIIDYKIQDGQLDNSNLTFKDLAIIREVLFKQLMSINHTRVEYPEEVNSPVS